MTNEKMEQRLAAALEKTAPDDVSGVLSRCEERKGTVINMKTKKPTKRKWTSLIAACLAVMLLGGGLFYQQVNAVASVVSLDVNPSIELKVNRSEKVLVCTPLNEDAKAILADMSNGADLKGAKIGRPTLTADDIPPIFLRHYPAFKNKNLNLSELARVCDISRTTAYKYIDLLEGRTE